MQFNKINAIIISSHKQTTYYFISLFSKQGIMNSIIYNSYVKKNNLIINNLIEGKFEIKFENNLSNIIEINEECFLLKNPTYEKLLIVNTWIKLIILSFDTGEMYDVLLSLVKTLNNTEPDKSEYIDIQYKVMFLITKKVFQLNKYCVLCKKQIKDNLYYNYEIDNFYCINCTKNKVCYIDQGSFNYLNFITKQTINAAFLNIKLNEKSKNLIKLLLKNKINSIFEKSIL